MTIRNLTIKYAEDNTGAKQHVGILKQTPCSDGREFDLLHPLEHIYIRLGPYDDANVLRIEHDEELNEYRVLFESDEGVECVFSALEEMP